MLLAAVSCGGENRHPADSARTARDTTGMDTVIVDGVGKVALGRNIRLCTIPPAVVKALLRPPAPPPRFPIQPKMQKVQAAILGDVMWIKGATLRVTFLNGSAALRQRVLTAARIWSQFANVSFEESTDPGAEIRVWFDTNNDSWSEIGRLSLAVPAGRRTMQFGWVTDSLPDEELRQVVLHEFGHALGLIHEHQQPNAGAIPWDTLQVYAYYKSKYGWPRDTVNANVLRLADLKQGQYSAFDTLSIMLYAIPRALTIGHAFEVTWHKELSATDKSFIRDKYPM